MYKVIHHTNNGPNDIAEFKDSIDAVQAAKNYLDTLTSMVAEQNRVITIWRDFTCVAVVLDDANGLSAYTLKRFLL